MRATSNLFTNVCLETRFFFKDSVARTSGHSCFSCCDLSCSLVEAPDRPSFSQERNVDKDNEVF